MEIGIGICNPPCINAVWLRHASDDRGKRSSLRIHASRGKDYVSDCIVGRVESPHQAGLPRDELSPVSESSHSGRSREIPYRSLSNFAICTNSSTIRLASSLGLPIVVSKVRSGCLFSERRRRRTLNVLPAI